MTLKELKVQFQGLSLLKIDELFVRYGWVTIIPKKQQLTCEEIMDINSFIVRTFTVKGNFTHLLPKIQVVQGMNGGFYIGIIVDESTLEKL